MSSIDGLHEQTNHGNQHNTETTSRRSSLATQAISQVYDSGSESQTARSSIAQPELTKATADTGAIDSTIVQQEELKHLEDLQGGRRWLTSYGHYHRDTEVSLHFKSIQEARATNGPFSLFPLLAKWIQSWYKVAQQKRKAEKLHRSAVFQEQDDFDWLLRFTFDYVGLGQENLVEAEVYELCKSVTEICQQTTRAEDIIASIGILHGIMMETIFPKDALKDTLEVLCAATILLPDPPSTLSDSTKLLLSGPVQTPTVDILIHFVTAPTIQNNMQNLTHARGALRHLRLHINLVDAHETKVIDFERLLDALYEASKCCIFRHCTEILWACDTILRSQRYDELRSSDLARFMDLIDNCVRTSLPRSRSTRSLMSLQTADREQVIEGERQNTRYLSERGVAIKALLASFEHRWASFTSSQRRRIADYFMDHMKQLSDSQASLTIQYLSSHDALQHDAEDWSSRLGKVFEYFVQNSRVSAVNRLQAIQICADAAAQAVSHNNETVSNHRGATLASGQNIVDRLLSLLRHELTTSVVRAVLNSLTSLAFCKNEQNMFPYASLIIRKLAWFVKNERESDDDVYDEHVLLFTCTIRKIFIQSLSMGANIAPKAYDALLEISSTNTRSRRCRLAALRLLVRLRCDAKGMVYLQVDAESQYIATALCRTDGSRNSFADDLLASQRGTSGTVHPTSFSNQRQLWSYPGELSCLVDWTSLPSEHVSARGYAPTALADHADLKMSDWLVKAIECLQSDTDWETYSFIVVHLGAQLFNTKLFTTSLEALVKLRQVLCTQTVNGTFREPPTNSGLKKSDTALCMYNMLTALIPYATMRSESIQKGFGDDLVRAFLSGIGGQWEGTARGCIHALCVCSFELPASVASNYPSILVKMSKSMTQAHLTIHILEFLTQVARLPEVHTNFTQDEVTTIFGICLQFLEKTREQHSTLNAPSPRSGTPARHSGFNARRPPYRAAMLEDISFPQYASALAYHTMIFWFLSLKLDVRAKYVSWITPRLISKTSNGDDTIDEPSQVFIDMMLRTAFSDLGESKPDPEFAQEVDGAITSASWIVGLSIVTAATAGHTGLTQITKRQAAGTTYAIYKQLTAPLPSHHVPSDTTIIPAEDSRYGATEVLPPHVLLQMMTTAAPTALVDQPIPLPQEEFVARAIKIFDNIPTVDSHKLGVVYIGEGQVKDTDFLGNTTGSLDYQTFLDGLGYKVSLEPPIGFNAQGLHYPRDGSHTIAWRDRITEIIYHVATMMPVSEDDPTCNTKKSHIGNCHVMIVFNESRLPWKVENFPSQVTFVHVVITPVNRAATEETESSDFYHVHVLTKEDYPNISPAADPKVISKDMLPRFVRMFGLNANVFSQAKVADNRDDDEFPSSWRARLQAIKTLKQRVIEKSGGVYAGLSHSTSPVSTGPGRKTPGPREDEQVEERDGLATQLDFGKWTL